MSPHLWPLHLKFANHGKRCTYYEYETARMKDVIALVSDESFAEGNFLGFLGEIQNANTAATDFSNSHRASIFHAQQQIAAAQK